MPRSIVVTIGGGTTVGVPAVNSVEQPFGAHSFNNGKVLVRGTPSGAVATSYRITATPGGREAFGATADQILMDGLSGGTAYTFTMAAWTGSSWTAESAPSSSFTPTTSPDIPTAINAQPSDAAATVNGTLPTNTGGSALQTVYVANNHDWDRIERSAAVSGTTFSILVSPLPNGTPISFIAWVKNAIGDSFDSARSNVVTPPSGGGGFNYAANQPVTASSIFGSGFEGSKAVDGNTSTRWASASGSSTDVQWIYVDLGQSRAITEVILTWDPSYAIDYKIQSSDDAATWTDRYTTTTGNGGTDTIAVSGTARYWRVLCTLSATTLYSIYEIEVRGP